MYTRYSTYMTQTSTAPQPTLPPTTTDGLCDPARGGCGGTRTPDADANERGLTCTHLGFVEVSRDELLTAARVADNEAWGRTDPGANELRALAHTWREDAETLR
jgi:hypothetical protein